MRCAPFAVAFLLYFAHPFSKGQTLPGSGQTLPETGPGGAPVVIVRPELAPPSPEANHKRLLADVQELIVEAHTLQQELHSTPRGTMSAQSFKRSQRIESLSKRIRKTLKLN